jgi:NTP pyrophosphatase (non-canonical NTP hydrolase)
MGFEEKKEEARKVYEMMQKKYTEIQWGPEHFMLDLVEEIGELANAVLVETGYKFRSRQKSTLEDAFFDVLFDILMLAERLNIDLDQAWDRELKLFADRILSGEFDS